MLVRLDLAPAMRDQAGHDPKIGRSGARRAHDVSSGVSGLREAVRAVTRAPEAGPAVGQAGWAIVGFVCQRHEGGWARAWRRRSRYPPPAVVRPGAGGPPTRPDASRLRVRAGAAAEAMVADAGRCDEGVDDPPRRGRYRGNAALLVRCQARPTCRFERREARAFDVSSGRPAPFCDDREIRDAAGAAAITSARSAQRPTAKSERLDRLMHYGASQRRESSLGNIQDSCS